MKTFFKIKDIKTGLYSTGGHTPIFTKNGKLWTKLEYVKRHLHFFKAIPDNWAVVEIVTTEDLVYPAKTVHVPNRSFRAGKLGPGYWDIPAHLVQGSNEWSEYVKGKMNGEPTPEQ